MKVFISWSGDPSRSLALALNEFLKSVIQSVETFISSLDVKAGNRWSTDITQQLDLCNFGILCLTRNNLTSSWILFEAGALAKSVTEGRVVPLLFEVDEMDFTGPLSLFQAKKFDKAGIKELVARINELGEKQLDPVILDQTFEGMWDSFAGKIATIPRQPVAKPTKRDKDEVLEELVATVRRLDRRIAIATRSNSLVDDLVSPETEDRYHPDIKAWNIIASTTNCIKAKETKLYTERFIEQVLSRIMFNQLKREDFASLGRALGFRHPVLGAAMVLYARTGGKELLKDIQSEAMKLSTEYAIGVVNTSPDGGGNHDDEPAE